MDKKGIWIAVGVAVIIILILIFGKARVQWWEDYDSKSKHPYGTAFIHQLLETKYGEENFQNNKKAFHQLKTKLDTTITYDYLKIGLKREYDKNEVDSLLAFVADGNTAFIALSQNFTLLDTFLYEACKTWKTYKYFQQEEFSINEDYLEKDGDTILIEDIPNVIIEEDSLSDELNFEQINSEYKEDENGYWYAEYSKAIEDSTIELNFTDVERCREDSNYHFFQFYKQDTFKTEWYVFNTACLDKLDSISYQILGISSNGEPNFIKINFGKGTFYFHNMPKTFTNVQLLDEDRLAYAEKVFSYLSGEKIIWDNHIPSNFNQPEDFTEDESSSPLSYLLSEKSLRWAIYLCLFSSLLFIFFRAKRKQQYIPVIEPKINTSIEYTEMMGQLYFKAKDHRYIALQLWKQFLQHIRSHYFILPKEEDDLWLKKLALKSQVSETKLRGIVHAFDRAKKGQIDEAALLNLYNKLQYFYTTTTDKKE